MRTILFILATLAVATAFHVGTAKAQGYPFCLISGPGPGDCKYNSYEQCMATASGTGKYCQPNYWLPEFRGAPGAATATRRGLRLRSGVLRRRSSAMRSG